VTGASITRGLLIRKDWLDQILAGTKTWEIRGKATALRGPIALIQSKSGHVVGTCELVEVVGPLSLADLQKNAKRTGFRPTELYYRTTYAWVMRNSRRLPEPIPYRHPPGAVIWVRLEPSVVARVARVSVGKSSEKDGQMRARSSNIRVSKGGRRTTPSASQRRTVSVAESRLTEMRARQVTHSSRL
jgi:hypothetical protein